MTALAFPELRALALPPAEHDAITRWLVDERFAEERPTLLAGLRRAASGDVAAREELLDAFSGPLPIGTGGRRGTCGPGPNRMNTIVLRETAQGLARAMAEAGATPTVAIVYDTRKDSRRFARVVAEQLARLGLGVTLVDAPRPTPLLSFTVRARGLGAGVVISASHNPPGDNGIKIYGADGAQVVGPTDRALMQAIEAAMTEPLRVGPVPDDAIAVLASSEALAGVDAPYLAFVQAQGVLPGDLSDAGLTVVYTPLHGVGHTAVLPVLAARGIAVHMVEAQAPDGGAFSTVESANPELPATLALAEAEARALGADLVVATDPDADRLGAMVRDREGSYAFIDGNRLGVLMLLHVLAHVDPPADGLVLTTVVTTPLTAAIARAHGVDVVDDLLVGFKHHAGVIGEAPERPCVFATEESHGYLRGNAVRDKDGAIAALLLCEAAAAAKRAGRTLHDDLADAWQRYGYHRESTANLYAAGRRGREAIAGLLAAWRGDPPTAFAGLPVRAFADRLKPRSTGSATRDLPGNVLVLDLDAGPGLACRVVLRPSGTEPKAKLYVLARSLPGQAPLADAIERVDALARAVLEDAETRAKACMQAWGAS